MAGIVLAVHVLVMVLQNVVIVTAQVMKLMIHAQKIVMRLVNVIPGI